MILNIIDPKILCWMSTIGALFIKKYANLMQKQSVLTNSNKLTELHFSICILTILSALFKVYIIFNTIVNLSSSWLSFFSL